MTDFSAAAVRPDFHPQAGKHNMASRAFEALRTQHAARGAAKTADASPDLSFGDLLDIANPLQHIPVISDIYRSLTGDSISDSARVAGDAIYGGPLGVVSGIFSAAIEAAEGSTPGEALIAALGGGSAETQKTASLAPETNKAQTESPAKEQQAAAYSIGTAWREAAADIPPAKRPVRQAAAQTMAEADGKAARPGGKPIPQLSPSAFNALLSAFGDSSATGTLEANSTAAPQAREEAPDAAHDAAAAEPDTRKLAAADPAPVPPSGFAAAMTSGLDKYRAMMQARDKAQASQ